MDEQQELWMDKIRKLAPEIEKAEYKVFLRKANVQKTLALLKIQAQDHGCKTVASQETWAESQDSLYQARLEVGIASGFLSSLKLQVDAYKIGFEEWRTKMVNEREERRRYAVNE
jgi:hypothetical protein|tara:strand:- start:338 stop:682 length:345 start_codon:yes stop_codon:yes gene_type:complete